MCGIAGYSLNKASKINARALSHALLTAIETRGRMSSGVAFPLDDNIGVYKDAVAGSNLPLRSMPRDTKTAIMHTRYATQGSPSVNDNNHPVWSPYGTIALVHNGVIWNDYSLRAGALSTVPMPEVDTAVIPALLEMKGLEGISQLAGDAAVAWLETADTDTLHLARIESSPVTYTNLEDGSFVFASTKPLLLRALDSLDLKYGEVFTMAELDYFQVKGGVIMSYTECPEPYRYGTGVAASTRGATSGGHTTTTSTSTSKELVVLDNRDNPNYDEDYYDAMDRLADKFSEEDHAVLDAAWREMSIDAAKDLFQTPKHSMKFSEAESGDDKVGPRFFTIDTEGNMETYDDLDELETRLLYLAGTTPTDEGFGTDKEKWVNHFADIGSFGFEKDEMISWVEEPSEIVYFQDPDGEGLGYIRDGVSLISSMAGR